MAPVRPEQVRAKPSGESAVEGAATIARGATLSAVIPTLNEAGFIGRTIARVQAADGVEIVVVDGGSRDDTVAIAEGLGARVIESEPGRGRQMNAGAAVGRGETLLFLHADTLLPTGFEQYVRRVLAGSNVVLGAFLFRLDVRTIALRAVERLVAVRCRLLGLPYGDQGLFLRRSTFDALGGFRDLPIMEDFDLVRRAGRMGRVEIAPAPATTSARRWVVRGALRTTLVNQLCVAAFVLGVAPARIASWREQQLRVGFVERPALRVKSTASSLGRVVRDWNVSFVSRAKRLFS